MYFHFSEIEAKVVGVKKINENKYFSLMNKYLPQLPVKIFGLFINLMVCVL